MRFAVIAAQNFQKSVQEKRVVAIKAREATSKGRDRSKNVIDITLSFKWLQKHVNS